MGSVSFNATVSGKSSFYFSSACNTEAVAIVHHPLRCPRAEISVDTQIDTRQTDTQTKYRNPRCACGPKVNERQAHRGLILHSFRDSIFILIWPHRLLALTTFILVRRRVVGNYVD